MFIDTHVAIDQSTITNTQSAINQKKNQNQLLLKSYFNPEQQ